MVHIHSAIAACLLVGAPLLSGSAAAQPQPAQVSDPMAQRVAACTACHGKEGRATSDGFFPRIAGKPAGYLYNQLINFKEGRRQYPMMTYLVTPLSDEYLKEIAEHFSRLHPPYPPPQPTNLSDASLKRGQALVMEGDRSRNIPACIACHGQRLTGVQPSIPSLVALPRDYLNAQFGAWKNGARKAAAPDCMAQITKQLSSEEISAVSAWLASRPIPEDMSAAPAGSVKLPIACGSFPQ
jgi:cytochrome c553